VANLGLHIEVPLLCLDPRNNVYFGILKALYDKDSIGNYVGIPLRRNGNTDIFGRFSGCPPLKMALNITGSGISFGRKIVQSDRIHFIRDDGRDIDLFGEPGGGKPAIYLLSFLA
jgi:hypothetical protein